MGKLTIGIPTYNGKDTIKKALDSIINQIIKRKLDVRIIISDNASDDGTYDLCREYNIKYSFLSLIQNETNFGFDYNVNALVNECNTEYLWIFSDNEILKDDNAVYKVDKFLRENAVVFLYLNNKNCIKINSKKKLFSNGNEFFECTKFKSGLITSNVINVNKWKSLDMNRYIGCCWIHFAYQIEALSLNSGDANAGIIYEYLFDNQVTDISEWGKKGRFLLIGLKLEEVFLNLTKLGYSKNIVNLAVKVIKSDYPMSIIKARIDGAEINDELYVRMKRVYGKFLSFKVFDSFFLKCPLYMCKLCYPVFQVLIKIKEKIHG